MFLPSPLLLTTLLSLVGTAIATNFVAPYPVSDCSSGIVFGGFTCPNQPGCCSGGAICCAGGCCPIAAWCVNAGTSNEGCCPLSDKTNCGAVVPTYTLPPCDGRPKPSVQCVSADDDWYCPHGYVCGTVSGACFDFAADCTTPGTGGVGGGPTPTAPPSSPLPGGTSSTSSVAGGGGSGGGGGGGSGTTGNTGGTTTRANNAGALVSNVYTRGGVVLGALVVVVVGIIV